jgi:hypothetical protein
MEKSIKIRNVKMIFIENNSLILEIKTAMKIVQLIEYKICILCQFLCTDDQRTGPRTFPGGHR